MIWILLQAILYKAWRINLRQYVKSFTMIILPLIPIIFYVQIISDKPSETRNQTTIIYEKQFKSKLLEPHRTLLKCVYFPKSTFTDNVMVKVANQIQDFSYFAVDKESDILHWFMNETKPSYGHSDFDLYGITFDVDNTSSIAPNHFSYTISGIKENLPETDQLFPIIQFPGPMEAPDRYFRHQFIRLKVAINDAFLSTIGVVPSNWSVQYFPYPEYEFSSNENSFHGELYILLSIFFLYTFTSLGSLSLNEKKNGITERLRMVGLNDFMILLNYLVHGFMIYIFSTAILAFLLQKKYESATIFPHSNFFILWIILILFCLQSTTLVLTFSSFFNNPNLAATLSVLVYYAPIIGILSKTDYSATTQGMMSLMPILYLYWTFQNIIGFEGTNLGATFSTLFRIPPSGKCELPLIGLILISLCSTVLLSLVYLYIVLVKPGPYGSAKPWHFIFSTYIGKINSSNILNCESKIKEGKSPALYERVPDNVEVGLHISNLHKRFGNVISVNGLSLDIYVGQITALLGHNGAGKTTTLSMISGMLKPTSGSIYYKGYSIFSDLKAFRRDLGLCPQENMLMENLTVWEHLIIFAMIKGLSGEKRKTSCEYVLLHTMLSDKKNALVNKLSGGMKRKLCLALALIGDPKVLILDEPTSGLDPESRREIWNILLKFREYRVMIITTHFMAEADVLGDQIAIMDHGEIKCYGSPMFLKKNYGTGYQITLCFQETTEFDEIINYITSEIPEATVLNKTNEQIVFNIPSSHSKDLPKLFEALESGEQYPISRIGISSTTMDDVFLKVQEEAEKENSRDPSDNNIFKIEPALTVRHQNIFLNFLQRLFSLIQKNILYMKSSWATLLIMVLIIPSLFAYWAIDGISSFLDDHSKTISYDLNIYGSTEVLLDGPETSEVMKNFINIIKKDGHRIVNVKELKKDNIIDGLLYIAKDDEIKFRHSLVVAGDFNGTVPNMLLSTIALHSPVIGINLLYNSLLKGDVMGNAYSISIKCSPINIFTGLCGKEIPFLVLIMPFIFIMWCLVVCSLIGNNGIKPAHVERTSLLKHLQLMTGLSPFTYWLSIFVWDFIVYCFSMVLSFIILKIFDVYGLLAVDNASGVFILIIILYGISGFWNAYCFTYILKTSTGAFNLYYTISTIFAIVSLVCFYTIPITSKWIFVNYIWRLFPTSSFTYAIQLFFSKSIKRISCTTCENALALPFCATEMEHGSLIDSELKTELWFLGLDWIIYFAIVMLIDYGVFSKLLGKIEYYRFGLIQDSHLENIEADVAKERDRVDAALIHPVLDDGPAIVIVDNLGKKYSRKFTAVYEVSFASKEGECFGLLGINGAGKTTTFNILSGVQRPTQGRVLIKGEDLSKNKRMCLSHIGYCPQISALGESLTGRQIMKLFANLRLVPPSQREEIVDKWIRLLGLQEYADRSCGTYSGGNKRKLSTALAFINNPAVILLDEPTSGVDPVTRRNIWNALKNCQNNKQTIIISSHSMDECEAVCDRITIMVSGYMQCIGNIQRLKELYGQGFIILIKLKDNPEEIRNLLKERIANAFGDKASLKDEHLMLLHYHISDSSYKLFLLFGIMEDICQEFEIIEEYSISDSSLEQIFLSFAKKKGDE